MVPRWHTPVMVEEVLHFLAIRPDGIYLDAGVIHPVGGSSRTRRVHPHVERPRLLKREPSLRSVELERGHAQVGQDPVYCVHAYPLEYSVQMRMAGADKLQPGRERSQALLSDFQCHRIPIYSNQLAGREPGANGFRVAAGADGRIQVDAVGPNGQEVPPTG